MNPPNEWDEIDGILAEEYANLQMSGGTTQVKTQIYKRLMDSGHPRAARAFMTYSSMEKAAMADKPTFTFINSPVGNLNLGTQVGKINTNLSVVSNQGVDGADFAKAISAMTEEVLHNKDLSDVQKKDAVDAIEYVSQQAATKPEERKSGLLQTIVGSIQKILSVAGSGLAIWAKYGDTIKHFFGLH